MANNEFPPALKGLDIKDVGIDSQGRLVIDNPAMVERLTQLGRLRPIGAASANDLNIICCGNGSCPKAEGPNFLERMVAGQLPAARIG